MSLLVWRDAKTDPPTGQTRGVLVEFENGRVWTMFANTVPCEGAWDEYGDIRRWAELPVVSDLTDDDVRNAADWLEPHVGWRDCVADRLRAALGGEKEEA